MKYIAGTKSRMVARATVAALAALGMVVLGNVNASADTAPSVPAGVQPSEGLERLLAAPFVSIDNAGAIVVDLANDPQAAGAALSDASGVGALEGATILVTGTDVLSASAQRLADAVSMLPANVLESACPDRPSGPREAGRTVPYLGCDLVSGVVRTGLDVLGLSTGTLGSAARQVVTASLPGLLLMPISVSDNDGAVTIAFPQEFAAAARRMGTADAYELDRNLVFTAYSNGGVKSLALTVNGDCLAYALAVGGDTCATRTFVPTPEEYR